MRDEKQIKSDLDSLIQTYQDNHLMWNAGQIEHSNKQVKTLQKELNDYFIQGCLVPLGIEGNMIGMRRSATVVEIGCIIKTSDGKMKHVRAQGSDRDGAVMVWNRVIQPYLK